MAAVEQNERERQASAYETLAEMFDAVKQPKLASEWRAAADALLAADIAESGLAEAAEAEAA